MIETELKIHKRLGTGVLVIPSPNMNIVVSWIILHYKLNKKGSIGLHKSRLMAQCFTQHEGIDFNDTFSLMAKLTAVRITTPIAVRNDWKLEQMAMDTAYPNASLKEDIYIVTPKTLSILTPHVV